MTLVVEIYSMLTKYSKQCTEKFSKQVNLQGRAHATGALPPCFLPLCHLISYAPYTSVCTSGKCAVDTFCDYCILNWWVQGRCDVYMCVVQPTDYSPSSSVCLFVMCWSVPCASRRLVVCYPPGGVFLSSLHSLQALAEQHQLWVR